MGILSGNQKEEPMHYGEIFGVWRYLGGVKSMMAAYQTFLNHTGDVDLKKIIEDQIANEMKPQIDQLDQLLKMNGIGLPPAPPERPVATLEDIPAGARFSDPEIANAIMKGISAGLVSCSQIMGQSTREDIALMFGQFHMNKAQFGARMLRLNKDKNWLVPPPLHVDTPEPAMV